MVEACILPVLRRGRAKDMGESRDASLKQTDQRTTMKFLLSVVAAALVAFSGQVAVAESVQRAAAVVNGVVISTFDLNQRIKMILATSGGASGEAAERRLREQVLRTLIDEILQLSAAKKDNITISDKDIDASIQKIAEQNKTSPEKILGSLAAAGVHPETLRTQIQAELAWSKIIEERIAPRVNVSESAIDLEMKRIADGATKPQFLVSEIFISIDAPGDEPRARRAIDQIYQQLQSGTTFPALATEFSESASAARGGDLGWIQDGDVSRELWNALQNMRPQTLSQPIRAPNGYYILALRDKMRPAGSAAEAPPTPPGRPAGVPAGSVKLKRVVLGLPPQMSKADQENFMRAAGGLREAIKGCQGLEEMATKIQGVIIVDLPVLPIRDLAPELQRVVQGLNPSDVSQPFFSKEGEQNLLNMLVVCGDRPRVEYVATRVFQMPSREEVANRMFSEQISVMARRFMRDMRRDATIEIRDSYVLNAATN